MNQLPILIADIGGTNARFALATNEQPFFFQAQTYQCLDFENINMAIDAYLGAHNLSELGAMCFAVAGPIMDGRVSFTNNHWNIDVRDLMKRFNTSKVHLLNDFEAIAYSLPTMTDENVISIGSDWALSNHDFTVGVIGPGSGLGVAGLMKKDNQLTPMITEGGHAGFSPESELQIQILSILIKKYGRVSNERVLSGPGLMNIHEALCEIHGKENPGMSASDIAIGGTRGDNQICRQSMDLFFEILGQVAGDVALTLGATNGIYIGGGIVQRYPEYLRESKFREGFENKGRYRELMQSVPTWLIKRENPGLVGCSVFSENLLAS